MSVINKFEIRTKDGSPVVYLEEWLAQTGTEEEQKEFAEANKRQLAYRQAAIDCGDLADNDNMSYRWKDEETFQKGKPTDLVWHSYWKRWEIACNIEVVAIKQTIDD